MIVNTPGGYTLPTPQPGRMTPFGSSYAPPPPAGTPSLPPMPSSGSLYNAGMSGTPSPSPTPTPAFSGSGGGPNWAAAMQRTQAAPGGYNSGSGNGMMAYQTAPNANSWGYQSNGFLSNNVVGAPGGVQPGPQTGLYAGLAGMAGRQSGGGLASDPRAGTAAASGSAAAGSNGGYPLLPTNTGNPTVDQLNTLQNQANAANNSRYNQALGLAGSWQNDALQRENIRTQSELGRSQQYGVGRGLGNTTVMDTLRRGVIDDSQLRQNEITDQANKERLGIISSRTDQQPNLGLYASLLSRPGASGGGGVGFSGGQTLARNGGNFGGSFVNGGADPGTGASANNGSAGLSGALPQVGGGGAITAMPGTYPMPVASQPTTAVGGMPGGSYGFDPATQAAVAAMPGNVNGGIYAGLYGGLASLLPKIAT